MEKPRIVIIDDDFSYIIPLQSKFVYEFLDDVEIEICQGRYGRQEAVALCYDGAVQRKLVTGDRVKIRKSEATAHLVKLSEESFMITMREKMKGNCCNESKPTCKDNRIDQSV